MSITNIFELFGGIGLFLFGMNMMSEGLEKAAGAKMKTFLETFTKNRVIGFFVGFIITGVIQSSSATTAMVVSFVNAGLMPLAQSVGVIIGSNVGTTITGQLIAFNFDAVAPLIIVIGAVLVLFVKNEMARKVGIVILGFGILFFGMSTMKSAMSVLSEVPGVTNLIAGISSPILLLIIGFVLTAVIQSSSATTGILIGMASAGLISLRMSFFFILGCGIGATVTAAISSLSGNRDAKRTALIHFLFNLINGIILYILLILLGDQIESMILAISPGSEQSDIMARAVANANTLSRLFGMVIMLPITQVLVKLTYIILPVRPEEKEEAERGKLQYIGKHAAITPAMALTATTMEIERMAKICVENMDDAMEALCNRDKSKLQKIFDTEDDIDLLCRGIQDYMVTVTQMQIPLSEEHKIAGYFHTIIDLERIGDHAENIAEFAQHIVDKGIHFSDIAIDSLRDLYAEVRTNIVGAVHVFAEDDFAAVPDIMNREDHIDKMEKAMQNEHIMRMSKGTCSPEASIYSDILSNLERVGDHANNIALSNIPSSRFEEITGKAE